MLRWRQSRFTEQGLLRISLGISIFHANALRIECFQRIAQLVNPVFGA